MDELEIERLGGLGGFGLESSRLRSRGKVAFESLSETDKQVVRSLFTDDEPAQASPMRDGFRYRIVWRSQSGERTIEAPEGLVPQSLTAAVKDTLE